MMTLDFFMALSLFLVFVQGGGVHITSEKNPSCTYYNPDGKPNFFSVMQGEDYIEVRSKDRNLGVADLTASKSAVGCEFGDELSPDKAFPSG